jgi:hypothetical protein
MKTANFSQNVVPSTILLLEEQFPQTRKSTKHLDFPNGKTENQIDHITIGKKWRRSLQDVRVKRGADAASDHHLVVAVFKTKLKAYNNKAERTSHKFNVHSLKENEKREEFKLELRNNFSVLSELPEETVEEQLKKKKHWSNLHVCNTWKTACETVLGKKRM